MMRAPGFEGLCGLKDLACLLQFGKLAFFFRDRRAHFGNFLLLFADLLENDLDCGLLDPGLTSG
jgi:hypothetical protein